MAEFVFLTTWNKNVLTALVENPNICMQYKPHFTPSVRFGWSTQWMNKRIMEKKKENDLFFFAFLDKMIQPPNSMPDNSADRGNLMWHSVLAISRELELEYRKQKAFAC